MKRSTDRLLTTHAGRLPSPPEVMEEDYRKEALLRVEALSHTLEGIPAERVQHHVCWGSWKGPDTMNIHLVVGVFGPA